MIDWILFQSLALGTHGESFGLNEPAIRELSARTSLVVTALEARVEPRRHLRASGACQSGRVAEVAG
jgi:hypothetical protein